MKDILGSDKYYLDEEKQEILGQIDFYHDHPKADRSFDALDKYSTTFVLQQAGNYLHSKLFKQDVQNGSTSKQAMNDLMLSLKGAQSKYETDLGDPKKVSFHESNNVVNKINQYAKNSDSPLAHETRNIIKQNQRNENAYDMNNFLSNIDFEYDNGLKLPKLPKNFMSNPKLKNYIHQLWNKNNYDYNAFYQHGNKPATSYNADNANNSWKMAQEDLEQNGLGSNINNFKNAFGKKHPGFSYYHGYYFPDNLNDVQKADMIYQYNSDKNAFKRDDLSTNNMYRNLWHSIYHGSANNFNKQFNNNYLPDSNNHPTNRVSADKSSIKANTNYQYQIQKDRIWEQYHQNQINRMQDYANMMIDAYGKKAKSILKKGDFDVTAVKNKTTFWGLGLKYHMPWQSIQAANPGVNPYYIMPGEKLKIPSKKGSSKLSGIAAQMAKYEKGGSFYNMELKLKNKWGTKADQLESQLPSKERAELDQAYLNATIDNLKGDPRHGHYAFIAPRNPETEDSYVFLEVTNESPVHENDPSSNPVEWGRNVTTSTSQQPEQISVSGYLFNNNIPKSAEDGHASQEPNDGHGLDPVIQDAKTIGGWSDAGAEMFYSSLDLCYPHCLVTNFNPDINTGSNGSLTTCTFTMTIQVVNYFKSNTAQKSRGKSHDHGSKGRKKGRNSTKKRRKHRIKGVKIKRGMTFCYVARRKHVPVSKLERLNKGMRARDLHIGSIMKV